jgi:hypothetical protein
MIYRKAGDCWTLEDIVNPAGKSLVKVLETWWR